MGLMFYLFSFKPIQKFSLNAVREICGRCPLVMSEDLLRDLAQYKKYRDRSVMMAAHSLIHLYRQHHPELLHRRDRVSRQISSSDMSV